MLSVPQDFRRALRQSGLDEYFEESTYVPRADYLSWIAAAKRPETRRRRIRKAVVRLFAQWQEEMSTVRARFNAAELADPASSASGLAALAGRRSD